MMATVITEISDSNRNGAVPTHKRAPPAVVEDELDTDLNCGYWRWTPDWLQTLNKPKWLLLFMCLAAICQGMVVNGFVNISISTIEKRFDLRSQQTGVIAGMYDIAVALVLIPVCHLGGYGHKGKWMGFGVLIMSSGAFIFGLPHFLVAPYQYASSNTSSVLCDAGRASVTEDCESSVLSNYYYMFVAGQFLHGLGAAPLYTLGLTYIDENVSQKMAGIYLGIYFAFAIIGPAIGYVLGGAMLEIYGEIGRVDISTVTITSDDPRWYGAWWIGPILTCFLSLLAAFPLLGYPLKIPGAAKRKEHDKVEVHKFDDDEDTREATQQPGFGRDLKQLPATMKMLFMNPPYVFLSVADAMDGFLVGGFSAFAPKFVENQFNVTASMAAILTGGVLVAAAAIGTIVGGWLIKRFSLNCVGIIKLALLACLLALASEFVLLIRCPNIDFAGVTQFYSPEEKVLSLSSNCNKDSSCNCDRAEYRPVCSLSSNVAYFSPCYAGCENKTGQLEYGACSCLAASNEMVQVREGPCTSDCQLLAPFLVIFTFVSFFTMIASIPTQTAILRCTPLSLRSIGVGFQWLIVRVIGTIPGPIITGTLIDSTCTLWKHSCGEETSCLLYDNATLSTRFLLMCLVIKVVSTASVAFAWKFYKPPKLSTSTDNIATAGDSVRNGADNPAFQDDTTVTSVIERATSL